MNTLSPFGKAIQLTKSICDPLFTTTNITTIESDEDTPGLSQVDIDNTAEDRKNLIKARQDNFRLNAEVKFLKSLLDQKNKDHWGTSHDSENNSGRIIQSQSSADPPV